MKRATSMKIVESFPPNYAMIVTVLGVCENATYCYGSTIYNPYKKTIMSDVEIHEQVHMKQQGDNIDAWWMKYLMDTDFRLRQEIAAYGTQYSFIRKHMHGAMLQWGLNNMAEALSSSDYGNLLTSAEAKSKIRNFKYFRLED